MSARKQMEKVMGRMKKGGDLGALMPQVGPDGVALPKPKPVRSKGGRRRKSRR
jgi:hypothetical protein